MNGYAQREKIDWNNFELTGGRFKTTLIGVVEGKPDWPYYVAGGVAVGAGVYLITRNQQEGLPVLTVSDDALSVFCGSSASANVLANDVGEGMQVTAVTQPAGATVMTTTGGNVLITNIGNASFSFMYTVTDRAGQTATGRVEVAVNLLPISAVDDAFTPISTMPLSGNVLMNDVGTQINVVSNTLPSGGLLVLAANGQFTYNADPGFCGTTSFSYTIADACNQSASASVNLTIEDREPPMITCPPAITVPCGSSTAPSATGTASATDNCTPTGQIVVAFTDQTPGPGCDGTIMRMWMAIDLSGNTGTCTQLITISDLDAPVISCPPDVTVPYGAESDPTITGLPEVSDPCGNPVSTTFTDNLSDFSNCTGMIVRNWVATDDCGNSSVCQQSILVEAPYSLEALDITPPSTPSSSDGMVVLSVTPNSVVLPMSVFVNGVFHSTANAPVFIISGLSAGNHTFRIIEAFGNGCASNEITVFLPFMSPTLTKPERKQEWELPAGTTLLFNHGSIGKAFGQVELRFSANGKKMRPYIGLTGQWQVGVTNNAAISFTGFPNDPWEINLRAGLQFKLGNNTALEWDFPTFNRLAWIGKPAPAFQSSTRFSLLLRQRFN